jgi:hypothetical protein
MKCKELQLVDDIEQKFKISYKYKDILGNGAFGTVRIGTKNTINDPNNNENGLQQYLETKKFAIKMMDKLVID